jgi:predicted MFS family arabinose efflux permease
MVAFVFGAHFSSYTFITPFLLSNAGFSSESISWILLGFGIIGFAANFAGTALVARTLPGTLAGVVLTLMSSLVLLPLLQHSAPIVVVLVLTWGAAFGAIPLCLSVWMQRATADHPEAGSALFVAIIQVAIATGSSVGGVIVDRVSIPADFGFGAALAVGGLAVLATFVASRSRKSRAASTSAAANVCSLEGAAD